MRGFAFPKGGTAGKGSMIRRKGGSGNGSPDGSRPAHGRLWIALGVKPQAGSAYGQPVIGRTGKQADRQAGRLSGMQAVGGSSSGSSPDGGLMSPCLRIRRADRFQGRCAACHQCKHADMQTVTRAGMPARISTTLQKGQRWTETIICGAPNVEEAGRFSAAMHNLKKQTVDA